MKSRLLEMAQTAVYNADDRAVRLMIRTHRDAVPFSVESTLDRGWSIAVMDGDRWLVRDGQKLMRADELSIGGRVGEANALAALGLVEGFGFDAHAAVGVLRQFEGLPHRMQHVARINEIDFINDSKATNAGAAIAAVESAPGPVVLIAGGLNKGGDLGSFARSVADRLRTIVLIGDAADALEAAFAGSVPVVRADSLESAVSQAAAAAVPGDTVLLAPACASLDMFTDYQERGERFRAAVSELRI